MKFDTEKDVRDFLRLCLAPGHGTERTPAKLAEVMPDPLYDALVRHAPHLGKLRAEADRQEAQARRARKAYADALAAWINTDPADSADVPGLCPQNRRGGQREPQPHFYQPDEAGVERCLFCSTVAHWGGEPARAYRTPDGRVWTKATEATEDGVTLYEAPFVGTRYTALALEQLHGEIEPFDEPAAPPYVLNSRSVNQSPQTSVKHIPDDNGRTICPGQYQATEPLPEDKAAEYALCSGCRKTLLARHETADHADA
ncbi:hypothetical protein [Streptomyces sp. NPDC018693]|uniref:hypothetical protein n=1 Tax=unclassified Streptomyces TaxID=2593676 RepID=UPI00379DF0A0